LKIINKATFFTTVRLLFLIIFFNASWLSAQQMVTLNGEISDAANGESLIGAVVYIKQVEGGAVTNVYGFYSLSVPPGTYDVEFRYVGFNTQNMVLTLTENRRLDIELVEIEKELNTVVVSANREDANISDVEMSTAKLDIKSILKVPTFAGEVDIIKSIQLLPGVSTVGEGASGFNVRGGGAGQNLVLLDEAPVYQTSHLFGFFSVFNPDAVKDVKLYKGGIPPRYGGRLASILDIRMKEGNNKSYEFNGGVGTVFSRFSVEGPIKKEKASFILAGRRSYLDVLAKPFTDVFDNGAALYFYDLTAKANWDIDDRNRVYLSGYFGRDVFKFDERQGFDWGNQTGTIRWNHLFSDKLFSNFTGVFSDYDYGFSFGDDASDTFDWSSNIKTYDFKPEFNYFLDAQNEIIFGAEFLLYEFEPANAIGVSDGFVSDISLDKKRSLETSVYFGNNQKINDRLSTQYGLRISSFRYLGRGNSYSYGTATPGERKPWIGTQSHDNMETIAHYEVLEPRASMRYTLNPTSSIKGSYNRMNQFIHLISNTAAATPIDVWQPSTNNIKPQTGNQIAVGYFKNFKGNLLETSAEVYYKWNKNQVDYIDGADILINEFLEGDLLSGDGRAYGLELYLRKTRGRFNGWISYTLGKSELKIDGVNYGTDMAERKGQWYPNRFDQRHNLKITSNYQINDRITLSGVFSYLSGTPTTFPNDRFSQQGYVIPLLKNERGNVRIPDYHRLDVSITWDNVYFGKKGRKNTDYFVFSVYNLYNRRNPFAITFSQGSDRQPINEPVKTMASQISIIGSFVPAFSYNFKF